jgi:hypothetical protein
MSDFFVLYLIHHHDDATTFSRAGLLQISLAEYLQVMFGAAEHRCPRCEIKAESMAEYLHGTRTAASR